MVAPLPLPPPARGGEQAYACRRHQPGKFPRSPPAMGGPEIEKLIGLLARLPGMGPRSARRAALKMLQQPEARMLPLATALAEAARAVKSCSLCGNLDS